MPSVTTTRPSSGDGEYGQIRSSSDLPMPRPACEGATHSSVSSSMTPKREELA